MKNLVSAKNSAKKLKSSMSAENPLQAVSVN
jgi:hypothetical protein